MKWKTVVGVGLIIGSLLMLVFWETKGRDYLLSPVISAEHNISAGTIIGPEDFSESRIPPENILAGAVLPKDAGNLVGMSAKCDIWTNQQLLTSYFQPEYAKISTQQSIFVLPELWIFSRSSALRAGDTITLYALPGNEPIGAFVVAFVKDSKENEVRDLEGENLELLDRRDATSGISHIEIICTLDEYLSISNSVTEAGFGNLLIVIRGEK